MKIKLVALSVTALTFCAAVPASATQFIANGGFEDSQFAVNTAFGSWYPTSGLPTGTGVTSWTGYGDDIYFIAGTQSTVSPYDPFNPNDTFAANYPSFDTLSPQGGNFVVIDGDQTVIDGGPIQGSLYQTISGLITGDTYQLTFSYAATQLQYFTGPTTEQLQVTFGTEVVSTPILDNASMGFTGWKSATFSLTATAASEVLTFLSIGTPGGIPPAMALDGVSLTGGVPEPGTWAMMLLGFTGIGGVAWMRRRRSFTATV
jgi:Protein of unknown function (DUF642)/PEP-CTERM motif